MQLTSKKNNFIFIIIGIIGFFISSCQKKEVYPIIPIIEFKDYSIIRENGVDVKVVPSFSFKDGDGDIGYPDGDSINMSVFVYYYKKKGGVFYLKFKPDSSKNFNVKLPMILNDGIKRPIKGDIDYLIDLSFDPPSLSKTDTIYFEFYLQDRALNKSNLIASPIIVLKKRL